MEGDEQRAAQYCGHCSNCTHSGMVTVHQMNEPFKPSRAPSRRHHHRQHQNGQGEDIELENKMINQDKRRFSNSLNIKKILRYELFQSAQPMRFLGNKEVCKIATSNARQTGQRPGSATKTDEDDLYETRKTNRPRCRASACRYRVAQTIDPPHPRCPTGSPRTIIDSTRWRCKSGTNRSKAR